MPVILIGLISMILIRCLKVNIIVISVAVLVEAYRLKAWSLKQRKTFHTHFYIVLYYILLCYVMLYYIILYYYYTAVLNTRFWLVNHSILRSVISVLQTVAMYIRPLLRAQLWCRTLADRFCVKILISSVSSRVISGIMLWKNPLQGDERLHRPVGDSFTTMTGSLYIIPYILYYIGTSLQVQY